MSEFKGTPGPWLARQFHTGRGAVHGWWVIDSIPDQDGRIVANAICQVSATNDDADANAKLLAAAPDLLGALVEATLSLSAWAADCSHPTPATSMAIDRAKAAIAKATGK